MKHPSRDRLLRNSLRANGAFSTLSGLVFVLGAGPVAEAIGLGDARGLAVLGLNLLGFAALLFWLAARKSLPLAAAMAVVWMDLAWVAGTAPVVMADLLNRTGAVAAVAVADVVLLFAVLQYLGIRRIRGSALAEPRATRAV